VLIAVDWSRQEWRIAIRDAGPGFPSSVLQPGARSDFPLNGGERADGQRNGAGFGVGLLLTQSAIEQLGGRLQLSNPPDGGALATIFLPLENTP
jgi:two-component system sensor histidine kinase RegB